MGGMGSDSLTFPVRISTSSSSTMGFDLTMRVGRFATYRKGLLRSDEIIKDKQRTFGRDFSRSGFCDSMSLAVNARNSMKGGGNSEATMPRVLWRNWGPWNSSLRIAKTRLTKRDPGPSKTKGIWVDHWFTWSKRGAITVARTSEGRSVANVLEMDALMVVMVVYEGFSVLDIANESDRF